MFQVESSIRPDEGFKHASERVRLAMREAQYLHRVTVHSAFYFADSFPILPISLISIIMYLGLCFSSRQETLIPTLCKTPCAKHWRQ